MSPISRNLRDFSPDTFLLSSFIISSSHDRGISPSGWTCSTHCSTLIRVCIVPNLLGMLSSYWIAWKRLQDWRIKLLSRHGRETFFRLSVEHALWWYSVLWDTQPLLLQHWSYRGYAFLSWQNTRICTLWDSSVKESSEARRIFHLLFCNSSEDYKRERTMYRKQSGLIYDCPANTLLLKDCTNIQAFRLCITLDEGIDI